MVTTKTNHPWLLIRQTCRQALQSLGAIIMAAFQGYYCGQRIDQLVQFHLSDTEVQRRLDKLVEQYNTLRYNQDPAIKVSKLDLEFIELDIQAHQIYLKGYASGT